MSNNKKVLGILIAGAIIGYLGILIIKSLETPQKNQPKDKIDDPFDTTELTNSYIYDHSQITK